MHICIKTFTPFLNLPYKLLKLELNFSSKMSYLSCTCGTSWRARWSSRNRASARISPIWAWDGSTHNSLRYVYFHPCISLSLNLFDSMLSSHFIEFVFSWRILSRLLVYFGDKQSVRNVVSVICSKIHWSLASTRLIFYI